jgi:hypothetical protein
VQDPILAAMRPLTPKHAITYRNIPICPERSDTVKLDNGAEQWNCVRAGEKGRSEGWEPSSLGATATAA